LNAILKGGFTLRVVILSDSHGHPEQIEKIINQQSDADFFVDLGDSQECYDLIRVLYPDKKFHCVSGNCDEDICLPGDLVIPIDEKHSIFATHGHRYAVSYSRSILRKAAESNGCSIACYGHTHVREHTVEDGIHILNPGSCARPRDGQPPSYAYIDIVGDQIFTAHVSIK